MITVSKNCMKSLIKIEIQSYLKIILIYIHNDKSDKERKITNDLKMSSYFIMLSTYTSIKGYDSLIEIGKILKKNKYGF